MELFSLVLPTFLGTVWDFMLYFKIPYLPITAGQLFLGMFLINRLLAFFKYMLALPYSHRGEMAGRSVRISKERLNDSK